MRIETNSEEFLYDIHDVVKLFYPFADFENDDRVALTHQETISDNGETLNYISIIVNGIKTNFKSKLQNIKLSESSLFIKKYRKRYIKKAVYDALVKLTGKTMPWGSLTGIRPTRLCYELLESGVPQYLLKETMMKEYGVSEQKAMILCQILKNQQCIINNDNLIELYINIPFCPSKCSYCTFLSAEYESVKDKIDLYIDTLIKEIKETKKIIFDKALVVRTIYIGGGTPSVLSSTQLDRLLDELSYPVTEFTVECGRPETITKEKLEVLKKHKVSRICINPQTFNLKTLKQIGRKHTVDDVINAYKLALEYDFDVNMDLIAGLPGEKFSNFKHSIDTVLELSPANITIHTLSLKKGGDLLKEKEVLLKEEKEIVKMFNYGIEKLMQDDYQPYYLYRQKGMISNQENIGFQKPGKTCIFNVDSMEETCSILACGANAISKRVFHLENRIERCANVKFLPDYLSRTDEMIDRKKNLFK